MKKIFIALSLVATSLFSQPLLNFQFQFANSGLTSVTTSTVVTFNYLHTTPFKVLDVDLSSWVCEGQTIKMKNLTNGAYNSPVENITSATTYDAGWGVYYHENCNNYLNWESNITLVSGQQWYQSYKNITIPVGATYPIIPETCVQSPTNNIFPSTWMSQLPASDPCTYKYMLFAPRLQNGGFNGIIGGQTNTMCNRGLGIRIKVKKAPKALDDITICLGTTATFTTTAGSTMTNWVPSNPNVTPVTATTTYSVTLTNPTTGCSYVDYVTVNGMGANLQPAITGASTVCTPAQLEYYGEELTGGSNLEGKWELFECNMFNCNTMVYSTNWNPAYVYANHTLPLSLPSGKSYKLRYYVRGNNDANCYQTQMVEKTIYIAPFLIAGYDGVLNVCLGSSTTLCAAVPSGCTVSWALGGKPKSTPCVTITPTANINGVLTLKHTASGCVSTSTVPITVLANNANLSATATANSGGSTITISVNPSVPNPLPAGYQSYYVVEKLTGTNGTTVAGTQTPNSYSAAPFCWKDKITPSTLSEYNGVSSVTCGVNGSVPNGIYKITRYVRNANCDWTSASVQVGGTGRFANFASSEENELTIHSDLNAIAFPNPTSGLVKIDSKETVKSIHITTITGALVKDVQNETEVDLNNYPSGMYFFTILTENGKQTIKVIKE